MKLLYITNGINGAGGLERVLSVKASYLADNFGYQVTILTLNETHPNSFYKFSKNIKLQSLKINSNPLSNLNSYIKGIKKIAKEVNPDVIAVCDDGLKGFIIPRILKKFNIPIIYERHVSKEIEMNKNLPFWKKAIIKVKWKIMDYLGADFSKFVVLTSGNLNEWKKLNNTKVISNPLSFYPSKSSALDQKKVIAVGKQGYQKGYDLLLEAWAIVAPKCTDWKLEIYGKKEPEEGLEVLAKKLSIGDSVLFYDPVKNIEDKYLESSIYVMSSRFEGFGMVLIEAMACGVPCVSFDCNYGPGDIIKHGEDGFLTAPENVAELAEKIIYMIKNDDSRVRFGINAKENVKRFLPENIMEQWTTLFKSLST